MLTDNLVINKDGSLLAVYSLVGVDAEGLPTIDVDMYAKRAEQTFRDMNEQVIVWSQVDRRRSNAYLENSRFGDPVSQFIDDEWRRYLEYLQQYENEHYIAVLYSPKKGTDGLFDRVGHFVEEGCSWPKALVKAATSSLSKTDAFHFEGAQLDAFVDSFEKLLNDVTVGLGDLRLKRLAGDELRSYLHDRCAPASEGQNVKASRIATYLDTYLTDNHLTVHKNVLEFTNVNRKFVAALSVKDWPEATYPGVIDSLLGVQGEITISQCFRFVEDSKAETFIQKVEKHNISLQKSFFSYMKESMSGEESTTLNTGRVQLAEDAGDALRELTAERKRYGYYSLTILIYGDTEKEVNDVTQAVNSVLRGASVITIREGWHLQSTWASTLPGQWGLLLRWHFMNIANLADLCLFRSFKAGERTNKHLSDELKYDVPSVTVMPTERDTPYFFNFHVGDVGHAFVVGPTGNGKSTFTNFLISQIRKYGKDSNVFIFDKDYSCLIPTELQGGKFMDFTGEHDSLVRMNPLKLLAEEEHWKWIKSWLEILLTYRNPNLSDDDDKNIWTAIVRTAQQPPSNWRLSTLASFLTEELHNRLNIWLAGGQFGKYFDNAEDDFELSNFVAMEMGAILEIPILGIAILDYAFKRILMSLDGRPTLIEIEECWFMLSFPHLAEKIKDWLKTFRKRNAWVVFATQSLNDLQSSPIFSTIIDSIHTRIYLPNHNARAHYKLYNEIFGLNDNQIERIREARRKMDYYIVQPEMSRMVVMDLPKSIVAVMRSNPEAIQSFKRHRASRSQQWRENYINEQITA